MPDPAIPKKGQNVKFLIKILPLAAFVVLAIAAVVLIVGSQKLWDYLRALTPAWATVIGGTIVGAGALLGFIASMQTRKTMAVTAENARKTAENDSNNTHDREVKSARQDRYTKIADQLASEHEPVRLAGVYALAALADEWQKAEDLGQRNVAVKLLCAYLRATPRVDKNSNNPNYKDHEVRTAIVFMIRTHTEKTAQITWPGSLIDLSGADLSEADLSGADLSEADLSGADLSGANLLGTILRGSELKKTDLLGANLLGANLSGANLSGADLSGADLSAAILSWTELEESNLTGANLREAQLDNAFLRGANMTKANLQSSNLSKAKLEGAILTRAYLAKANLSEANLSSAKLPGADLTGATLTGVDQTNVDLSITFGIPIFGKSSQSDEPKDCK